LHKRRLATALVALVALVAVVAGCGGGGSSSSSTGGDSTSGGSTEADSGGSAPTKAAFIKEADKVCGKAEEELTEEVTEFAKEHKIPIEKSEPSEDQQTELFQEVVLPNIARQGEELAALTPPEGDEGTIEDLTSTLESEVEEAEDEGGVSDTALAGATKKARAYGFKVCGS
jgi:ABC-type glycerol-3-phosphate transport system substrate-binding protein